MPVHHPALSASLRRLLPLLLLAGCAAWMPHRDAPDALVMPAAWSVPGVSGGAPALVQWWRRFDDPLLSELVDRTLRGNTDIRSAQAALLQARALRDVAAAGLSPTLGGSASAQRGTAGGDSTGNSYRVGVEAAWTPDVFGAHRSALAASEGAALASAASLGQVQAGMAAEMALAYIALRGHQARLAIADDNLASQLETAQLTQWRWQAGLVSALETEQARGASEQTQAQLPVLRSAIAQSEHGLAVLTGQPPAALVAQLEAVRPVPRAVDDPNLGIPADTLRQRADVQAAEYRVAAALGRLGVADAARWPSFKLGGSLGLGAASLGALGDGASVLTTLLASTALPLFDGGARRAQVRAEEAALDQARLAHQAAVLTALREVEDALAALRGQRERLLRLQNAAAAAASAALMARQRFSSGLVDFQVVLETQRTQLNTQDSVASARADLSADQVRLYLALGGGWNPATPAEAAPPPDQAHRISP